MEFPLLAWSASLSESSFDVLDETRIPEEISYVTVNNYSEAVEVIRSMKTRAFGQLLTVFYALVLTARSSTNESLVRDIEEAAAALKSSRPTFAFGKYTDLVIRWAKEVLEDGVDQRLFVEKNILGLLEKIKQMRLNRASLAASLFRDGDVVLTHCNTSGELVLMARVCREEGKKLTFFATETRPYFQGRLTCWELNREEFDVTLIADNQAGSMIASGRVTKVITGADRVALNGDVINKVGTYQLALLAERSSVPFYSFVQEPGKTETGDDVTIEYRSADEVISYRGEEVYPEDIDVYYPAFDITPHNLITKLITFDNIHHHSELPEGWINKTQSEKQRR